MEASCLESVYDTVIGMSVAADSESQLRIGVQLFLLNKLYPILFVWSL